MSIFIAGFFDSRLYAMSLTIRFITKLSKVHNVQEVVHPFMFLLFTASICLIFAPFEKKKEQKTRDLNSDMPAPQRDRTHQEQACTMQDLGEMFGTSPSANQMNPMKTIMTTATQERGTLEVYFDRCRLLQRHIRTSTVCSTVSMKYQRKPPKGRNDIPN